MRWAHDGVVGVRQLARHLELDHVRGEGGAEGGSDTDEDERTGARRILLCLYECLVGLRLGLETVQIHSCQGLSSINVRTQAQDRQQHAARQVQGQGAARAGHSEGRAAGSARVCVAVVRRDLGLVLGVQPLLLTSVSNRLLHRVEKKTVTGRLQQTLSAVASLGGKRGTQRGNKLPQGQVLQYAHGPGLAQARKCGSRDSSILIDRVHFMRA